MATSPGASGSFDFSAFDAATRVQFARDVYHQVQLGSILLDPRNGFVKKQKGETPILDAPFIFRTELMKGTGRGNTAVGGTIRFFVSFQTGGKVYARGVDLKTVAEKANYTHYDVSINEFWKSFADNFPDTARQTTELVPWLQANPQIATTLSFLHELKLIMELAGYKPTTSTANAGYVDGSGTIIDPADAGWQLNDTSGPTDYAAGSPYRVLPSTSISLEADITNVMPITTAQIRRAVKVFRRPHAGVRPIKVNGVELFLLILHPDQYTLLQEDTAFKATNDTGASYVLAPNEHPRVTGKVMQWEDVLIVQHPYIPYGINASTGAPITTVRRAVLCGAGAACLAAGQVSAFPGEEGALLDFRKESENFGQENYVATFAWSGIKRVAYEDSRDPDGKPERSRALIMPSYVG